MEPRLIKLTNGAILDANKIVAIARQELNEYFIILDQCPVQPKANLDDVAWLEGYLNIVAVEKPELELAKV